VIALIVLVYFFTISSSELSSSFHPTPSSSPLTMPDSSVAVAQQHQPQQRQPSKGHSHAASAAQPRKVRFNVGVYYCVATRPGSHSPLSQEPNTRSLLSLVKERMVSFVLQSINQAVEKSPSRRSHHSNTLCSVSGRYGSSNF